MATTQRPFLCSSLAVAAVLLVARSATAGDGGAIGPDESARSFQIDDGLRIELVAAEPEVTSPVDIAFDERGRLWVVEMRDYPNGPSPGEPPEGRIRILEDRDGDGRFEHAQTFADGLLFANGVMPWRGGAIVTAAPHILFLADDDGDGIADRREVLYEGFAEDNPQLRVSHPILGLDGWIYVANGLRGGTVRRAGRPDDPPIDLRGRDFRFDPLGDRAETVSGMGQYGNTFDDWGHRFVCTNRNHLVPIVLEDRYIRRNPFLAASSPLGNDQGAGGAAPVFPLVEQDATSSLHVGSFTAACSVTIYRGSLLGAPYLGSAFTCEPTGSLVHQEILHPDGASFRGEPPHPGVEFLASTDPWCRPVNLATGPDGALYAVDMYRAVIEHPQWMPPELRDRPDLLDGKDRGRIWRIVPDGPSLARPAPQLADASTAELVTSLEHPDAWWRTTAQRLLLQRDDAASVGPLREILEHSESPLARVHAAWLLRGRGELGEAGVLTLLKADHPRIREHGLILSEPLLAGSPAIRSAAIALAEDPDDRVRFQLALSLGAWDDDGVLAPLAAVALAGADDGWTRLAVETAVPERAGALVDTLLSPSVDLANEANPGRLALLRELSALVGSRRDPGEIGQVLRSLWGLDAPDARRWRLATLDGLAAGMGRRGASLGQALATTEGEAAWAASALLAESAAAAEDAALDPATRLDATRLLAHAPSEAALPTLARLLADEPRPDLRLAAVRALAARSEPDVAARLLDPWSTLTPAVRREVADALIARPARAAALLDAVAAGQVSPGDLEPLQIRRLMDHPDAVLRDRARGLLARSLPADRRAVLDRYKAALNLPGDPLRGLDVFRQRCTSCHQIGPLGVAIGPDVGDNRTRTPEALLNDILDPNAAIDANYVTYTVALADGRVLSGLIASESASALTLRRAEGQEETVLRSDIEAIRSTGTSLMPEALEADITVDQMADLLAFLKRWRNLDADALSAEPRPTPVP